MESVPQPARAAKPFKRPGSVRTRRRRFIRKLLFLLLFCVASFSAYRYLTDADRLAAGAQTLLRELTHAHVRVGSAHFNWRGRLLLTDVEMRVPGLPAQAERLLEIPSVVIEQNFRGLWRGQLVPTRVIFLQPRIYITEDLQNGTYNFQNLGPPRPEAEPGRPSGEYNLPRFMPEVFVSRGIIQFGELTHGQYHRLNSVLLDGQFTAEEGRAGWYQFVFRQMAKAQAPAGPLLAGRINLSDYSFSAQLHDFSFDSPQRNMLPGPLRRWWDQFRPSGSVPLVRVGYNPDASAGFSAQLEVRDMALTIPYQEFAFPMTQVTGRFAVDNSAVTITNLTGKVEGVDYRLDGTVSGLTPDAPFTLELKAQGSLPEDPSYLPAFPLPVQRSYRKFLPSGPFSAAVKVARNEAGGTITYVGGVDLNDARATYYRAPYPLDHIQGKLTFNHQQVDVVDIHAQGPSGGHLLVRGKILPPGEGAEVHITVTGQDVPLDHFVKDALSPEIGRAMDIFLSSPRYQALRDAGLILPHQQKQELRKQLEQLEAQPAPAADLAALPDDPARSAQQERLVQIAKLKEQLLLPAFDLGGTIRFTMQIDRDYGPGNPTVPTIELDLSGLGVLVEAFPYPLRIVTGKLLIKPPLVTLVDVEARGLSGAVVHLAGHVEHNKQARRMTPHITVQAQKMPIDGLLLAAVPLAKQPWVAQSHLQGMLACQGKITRNEEGQIDYHIAADLTQGRCVPFQGQFAVDDVQGQLLVERGKLDLIHVKGKHGESDLELSGQVRWSPLNPAITLHLQGRNLRMQDPVLDLAPPDLSDRGQLTQLLEQYQAQGQFDMQVEFAQKEHEPASFHVAVQPHSFSFAHRGQRITLEGLTGSVTADPTGVRLDKLSGSFAPQAHGQVSVSGLITGGPSPSLDLTFDAQADRLEPVGLSLMPMAVATLLGNLQVQTGYQIRNGHLLYRPKATAGDDLQVDAQADLRGASLVVAAAISQLQGRLALQAHRPAGEKLPNLQVQLDAQSLLVAQRPCGPLRLELKNGTEKGQVVIQKLEGAACGGTVVGTGLVQLGKGCQYRVELTLQDADVAMLLHPPGVTTTAPAAAIVTGGASHSAGVASATFALEGDVGHPEKSQGRGRVQVRQASIQAIPLAMALLQLTNFSLPSFKYFDRAGAVFLMSGDTVNFEEIRFDSRNIQIIGSGTMSYASRKLDLTMYSRNPNAVNLGLITDMFSAVKNELVSIHVTGTLDNPRPRAASFQSIRNPALNNPAETPVQPEGGDPPVSEPVTTDQ